MKVFSGCVYKVCLIFGIQTWVCSPRCVMKYIPIFLNPQMSIIQRIRGSLSAFTVLKLRMKWMVWACRSHCRGASKIDLEEQLLPWCLGDVDLAHLGTPQF